MFCGVIAQFLLWDSKEVDTRPVWVEGLDWEIHFHSRLTDLENAFKSRPDGVQPLDSAESDVAVTLELAAPGVAG